jgi:hypothetical protein
MAKALTRISVIGALLVPVIIALGTDKFVYIITILESAGPKVPIEIYSKLTRCSLTISEANRSADFIAISFMGIMISVFVYAISKVDFGVVASSIEIRAIWWLYIALFAIPAFLGWRFAMTWTGEYCSFVPASGRRTGTYISAMSPLLREYSMFLLGLLYWLLVVGLAYSLTVSRIFSYSSSSGGIGRRRWSRQSKKMDP